MSHLDLDYADGHISPPLEPTPDDQGLVNDVLATRPNGGEARATLESGPLSVQDPPDGVGLYQRQLDVNVDSDGRLPDVAGWALHHGTWDDPHDRFPLIRTNMRRLSLAGLDGDVAALDVGDRLTIQHPPEWLPPDDIDQYVLGYTESIAVDEWTQDWHTTPAGPFNVLAWQDAETTPDPDAPARFDTDGSQTVGTFNAGTDTSLEVLTTRGPLWTQHPGDLPFHVRTSGVVLNVTGINAAVRDTFDRTVVNGWGVADSGQQWTLIEGAASDASVGSGVGTLFGVIMGVGSYGDVEVLAKVTPDLDGSLLARITDQGAGNWAYYEVALEATSNHVGVWIRDDVAEFYGEVAIFEIPIVSGTSYWCRMRVRGYVISFKVWPDGTTEPASWQLTYEDTDETVDQGAVGLAAFFGEAEFDDFAVVNPQRFTVDQAPANGIHKSIPAGSPLRLATPAAFGL